MPLTNALIVTSKPQKRPYKLHDTKGLYLLVHPNGSKYWRLKYRLHGKEKVLALGVYPEVSLAQARDDRDTAKKKIRAGVDPVAERQQEKRLKVIASENTFEAVAKEWHAQKKESWTTDHAVAVLASLERDVFPDIGKKPITEITTRDLLAVIRKVERRGALDVAARILQRTGSVLRYAVQTGRIEINPATELRGVLKTRKVRHQPALNATDLPEFLRKLDNYEGDPITRLALKFLVLTFVRPGEARFAKWDEIDTNKKEWRIPAERMKMRADHVVPLSDQALTLLDELKPLTKHRGLLFPGRNGEGKAMSENTMTYALYRMGYHSRATAHGFRATASTILNEQGWKPDVIERQLAHAEKNKVRAAYHRSEYLAERKKMMQHWADHIDALRSGAEVVNIRRTI